MKPYKKISAEPKSLQEPTFGFSIGDFSSPISIARNGVKYGFLLDIAEKLSINLQELSDVLHVSLRTLQRYVPSKKLDTDASSKALQLAAILKKGTEVFGSEKATNTWMNSRIPAFGGKMPKEFLDTPFGFQMLEEELTRIQHGVFA
jgi:putative toxin-antitoxin system antitoxin component (TIGR02293 family)